MPFLPKSLLAYIWFVAILAGAMAMMLVGQAAWPAALREWLALVLIPPMLAVALRFPLHLTAKTQHDTTAAPVIVAAVLLPPPLAVLAVGVGILAGELMKPTRRRAQVAFNVSVAVLALSLATLLAEPVASSFAHGQILAAGVASAVYWSVANVATELIIAIQLRQRPFGQWLRRNLEASRHEWALFVIGAIVALLAEHEPWALLLVPVPVSVVYRSFLYQQQRVRQAEAGLALAEGARARLTAIIDATPDFVATADPAGRLLYINEAGRSMLGLDGADELPALVLGLAFPGWDEATRAAAATGVWTGEGSIEAPGRQAVPVSKVVLVHSGINGIEFLSVVARDITAQKVLERRLSDLANHDPLTGLLNRRAFDLEMHHVLLGRASEGCLFFLDLDEFKGINDQFGHETGDRVLADVGTALQLVVAGRGFAGRLGGDEFAVMIPGLPARSVDRARQEIAAAVESVSLSVEGHRIAVRASVGAATFAGPPPTSRELLARADAAMYAVKNGRKPQGRPAEAA